jgi:16S rRNA processing protein RimM
MSDSTPAEPANADPDDLVAVAKAVKTRGLRGELVADLLTDFPERFEGLENLIAIAPDGKRTVLDLEEHFLQSGRVVLKFAGYDSIDAASVLIGCEFTVPVEDRVELAEDEYYDWQLAGCRVETVDGQEIGRVREVLRTGGVEVLVVEDEGTKREYLIPMAAEICTEINIERKLVRIDPPEGLLEL